MPFFQPGTYDLFLTHSWNYTDEWQMLVATLDEYVPGKWRNWSLPWHDTSIDRHSVAGKAELEKLLHGHISMAAAIILLPETIRTGEGRLWLDKQLQIASEFSKPVIGVHPMNGGSFPDVLVPHTHVLVRRDAQDILQAVRSLTGTAT
jgi:hypothetical protein